MRTMAWAADSPCGLPRRRSRPRRILRHHESLDSSTVCASAGDSPRSASESFVTFFVSIYFNAAVMGAAMIRLSGGDPTISDGLKVARENIKRIAGWALVTATVGLILRAIAQRFGFIGRIIAGIAGAAWGIVTYLVVPVLIFEKIGPWAAVKRSGSLLRQTWGEAAGGYLTLGGIFVLLALPALLVILLGLVVYWLILGLVGSAAQSILVTALYRYATTGELGFGLPRDLVAPPAGAR